MLEKETANQPHDAETMDLHNLSSSYKSQKPCDRQENLNKTETRKDQNC